jgi:hypothetical protein
MTPTPATDSAVSPVRELSDLEWVKRGKDWVAPNTPYRVWLTPEDGWRCHGDDADGVGYTEGHPSADAAKKAAQASWHAALSRRSLDTADGVDVAEALYDDLLPLMQVDAPDVYGRKVKAQAVILSALASRTPNTEMVVKAEPVAWIDRERLATLRDGYNRNIMAMAKRVANFDQPLYASPPSPAEVTATHRHVKRGSEYVLIGIGKMQAERWQSGEYVSQADIDRYTAAEINARLGVDMREVAIYRSVDDGSLWVRPREEFEDGRFTALASPPSPAEVTFQDRVAEAHVALFHDDPTDLPERRDRFYEEATEAVQSLGMTEDEAHQLVSYTFSRAPGDVRKEIGAAALTLASLCVVGGWDMMECAEGDLAALRTPEKIAKVRAKRATRHGRGPLPGLDASLQLNKKG